LVDASTIAATAAAATAISATDTLDEYDRGVLHPAELVSSYLCASACDDDFETGRRS
jgi:hypothetical protein